jgi:hypothetical protein
MNIETNGFLKIEKNAFGMHLPAFVALYSTLFTWDVGAEHSRFSDLSATLHSECLWSTCIQTRGWFHVKLKFVTQQLFLLGILSRTEGTNNFIGYYWLLLLHKRIVACTAVSKQRSQTKQVPAATVRAQQ